MKYFSDYRNQLGGGGARLGQSIRVLKFERVAFSQANPFSFRPSRPHVRPLRLLPGRPIAIRPLFTLLTRVFFVSVCVPGFAFFAFPAPFSFLINQELYSKSRDTAALISDRITLRIAK